jgi:hypothetical protein
MKGDGGDDTYVVDDAGDVVIENALVDGTDNVQSSTSYTLGSFVENLTLTGAAAISGTGNNLGNAIIGNNAANLLKGMAGADSLFGAGGADTLQGGVGDDMLSGGAGHDVLGGGLGEDGFRFDTTLNAAKNVDAILDFSVADDSIFLDRGIFTGLAADGPLAAGAFQAGTRCARCRRPHPLRCRHRPPVLRWRRHRRRRGDPVRDGDAGTGAHQCGLHRLLTNLLIGEAPTKRGALACRRLPMLAANHRAVRLDLTCLSLSTSCGSGISASPAVRPSSRSVSSRRNHDVGAEAFDKGSRSMPNTPPRLAGFTAAATFAENVVNGAPQVLDADVTLFDDEGNLSGGSIAVSGLLGEDRVGIRDQGMGAAQIGLVGNQIFYEGSGVGRVLGRCRRDAQYQCVRQRHDRSGRRADPEPDLRQCQRRADREPPAGAERDR